MIGVDIKNLIDKAGSFCAQSLLAAAGEAVTRSHYEVAAEHFFIKCLSETDSDLSLIVDHYGIDRPALIKSLNQSLEEFKTGNTSRPAFSPLLIELLEASWLVGSVDLGHKFIRTGAIALAYLKRPSIYSEGAAKILSPISREDLTKNFSKITSASKETETVPESGDQKNQGVPGGDSFIAKFCEDFTAKARAGRLDPVFGRDKEIRSMIDILARRRKNNPILLGEPGVGKTAVLEGLALRIVENDVPDILAQVTLLGLDLGLLEAGASMKGEFERRLKGVIEEIKSSPTSIVLFIDEAHTLIGAGGSAGGSDAANLLKPALARGELRTCAATTWKEYKKYFEKDPALARRFQPISLDEPDVNTTSLILRGLVPNYEKSHGVIVRDEALTAAAELSHRYISGRFLPDKAVDLLDTACARIKIGLSARPASLEDRSRSLAALARETSALLRDRDNGHEPDQKRLDELDLEQEKISAELANLTPAWEKERELAQNLLKARREFREAESLAKSEEEKPVENETALALKQAQEAYGSLPEHTIDLEVDYNTVAKVVSDWTGIPAGRMAQAQAALVADLENLLGQDIQGQKDALAAISRVIKASQAGLRDPGQPLGVFLLVGPSGVGKTQTGLALAKLLFGDEANSITISMSEFQEKHTVSRLIGSPPGYVGYGEGGLLTEAVRQKPYSVVLLDEVEKAHPDVLNTFYQVFDKGILTDGEGQKINFRNTILFLTSNLASDEIQELSIGNPGASLDDFTAAIRPQLSKYFKPALLARMTIVPYRSLDDDALALICRQKLAAMIRRLHNNSQIETNYSPELIKTIVGRCLEVETGARNIDFILTGSLMPPLAQTILQQMASQDSAPKSLYLDVDNQGEFTFNFDSQPTAPLEAS